MEMIRFDIWEQGEYLWPQSYGFTPFLVGYLHKENETKRPCVLVVPGGAYYIASTTEAEMVAKKFYEFGYQTFVLTYTTNILGTIPLKAQPMHDLSRAIRVIRSRAEEFHIAADQLATCGFSAGGHLAASEGVHYSDIEDSNPQYARISNRPDAMILCYPVIDTGIYAHQGSVRNLLGFWNPSDAEEKEFSSFRGCGSAEDELHYMALHTQVTEQTPPSFLWQTAADESVPVENSYLFAMACRKHQVPFAHHVFAQGGHGLSLSNEGWEKGEYGNTYTLEPFKKIAEAIKNGQISDEKQKEIEAAIHSHEAGVLHGGKAVKSVSVWPKLADEWMRELFHIIEEDNH